ncbi:hypothetical protein EDB84DRAFT_1198184 [Lactarius hengduanensis]|nr:hypothetical protein EDB84DRAFT_1198184 [Lactarius hengduanensis]
MAHSDHQRSLCLLWDAQRRCRFGIRACQDSFRWRRFSPLAEDVTASQDILVDIFGRIESFFVRLDSYTEVPLTRAMTEKMEITVEVLDILATATKEMEQSRKHLSRRWLRTDLEDGLRKLDKLTNEEVAMASVQLVKVTHKIDNKVMGIDATEVKSNLRQTADDVDNGINYGTALRMAISTRSVHESQYRR